MSRVSRSLSTPRKPRQFVAACAFSVMSAFATLTLAQSKPALTHHVPEVVQRGLAKSVEHVHAGQTLRLTLTLPLRNQTELENFIEAVSDPSSPFYRQYLTVEEFTERFGPSQEDYDAVINFAQTSGLKVVGTSRNRLNVDVEGPVSQIERSFNLQINSYQHPTENRTFYAPDQEPTADLPFRLWHVSGLDNYSIPQPTLSKKSPEKFGLASNATTGSGPSASFLGSDMRAAYYGGTTLTGSGQSLGLVEFRGVDPADLNTYFQNVGQTNNVPITLLSTDGTSTGCLYSAGCDDTEQVLDMTQAISMAPGLANLVVYVGSSDASILNAMATAKPLNAQLSISWAWKPADPTTDDPYFMEFAAQGQSVFAAAGDSGVWSSSTPYVFPADDTYVTSVGGTDLQTSSAGGPWSSETAWIDGGGGISPDSFAIPSWQTTAASGCALCSTAYRNGPDVSANANWTFYVCADQTNECTANEFGGTSFAAPMWAGYVALANQQSVAGGNATVGFINQALYSIGEGATYGSDFHDITSGNNGFPAASGYDLATGWGSPNGQALINALAPPSAALGFTLSVSPGPLSVAQGSSGATTIATAALNGFNSAITLSATGQPTGVTVSLSSPSIAAPGSGSSSLTFTVAPTVASGRYSIAITATGGGLTRSITLSLIVPTPSFNVSVSTNSLYAEQRGTASSTITTTILSGFNSAITFSTCTPPPVGISVTFSPATVAAPGNGTSTMTISVGSNAAVGYYQICVDAEGVGFGSSMEFDLDVLQYYPPSAAHFSGAQSTLQTTNYLHSPSGVAIDQSGNIYVADPVANTVMKETLSSGIYTGTIVAKLGLSTPWGIAVDSGGNVYIADSGNNRVLKETVSGGSYTQSVIGSGLADPRFVTVDSTGKVYISDTGNNRVVEESGVVFNQSTIASGLSAPTGIGTDGFNVYVGNGNAHQALEESPADGSYFQSVLPTTGLGQPEGIAVGGNAGSNYPNVYVVSKTTNQVLREPPPATIAGTQSTLGIGLSSPVGIAVDQSGNVYIADAGNNRLVKGSFTGWNFGSLNIGTTSSTATLDFTFNTATTLGSTAVLTAGVPGLEFADAGTGTCKANTSYTANQNCTVDLTFSPRYAGSRNGAAVLRDGSGNVIATGYIQGTGVGPQINFLPGVQSAIPAIGLSNTGQIAVDGSGSLYIADYGNSRVLKETLVGGYITRA